MGLVVSFWELQFWVLRNELHPWIQKAKQLSLPDPAKLIPSSSDLKN